MGKVDTLELHPMSYLEFLEAMGEEQLVELLKLKEYNIIKNFSSKYIFWLKNDYYAGGMPECAVRTSMPDYVEQDYLTNIPLYAVCNI